MMDGRYSVSYVVASYCHEKYILNCLDGILQDAETMPSFELIIIDDGSKDSSVKIINDWVANNSKRVQINFIARENRGVAKTLNELVQLSAGSFIRIVASDDMLVAGSTSFMLNEFVTHPTALAVVGDVTTIDSNGKIISESQMRLLGVDPDIYKNDLKKAIISKWAICGPALLLKRNFQEVVGVYDESLVIEDWSMYLRLVAADSLLFCSKKVALYRVHSFNTSRTRDIKKRITNLTSQKNAGEKALDLFTGRYRILLLAAVAILKAKIAYLEKDFLAAVGWVLYSFGLRFFEKLNFNQNRTEH